MAPEQACAAATHEPATGQFRGKIYNRGTFFLGAPVVNLRSTNFSATNSFQRAMPRAMAAKMGLG